MQIFGNKLSAHLSRITTSGNYLPLIDGLRFLAIAPVIVQHTSERLIRNSPIEFSTPIQQDQLAFLASRGTIGVFIFFAISGFMLSLPFARHKLNGAARPSIKQYFIRRFTRIEPPYLIWMSVFALVLLFKSGQAFSDLLPHWLASCFYVHNFVYGEYSIINPVAWSLEIEIQFYLIAPWLVQMFFSIKDNNTRQWALWAAILGFVSVQHGLGWQYFPYKATLLGQLPHFLVGIWLADCFLTRWKDSTGPAWRWDLLFVPALFAMAYTWTEEYIKSVVFALALAGVFIAAFKGKIFKRVLQNKWIATTGGMCYTIYLIHLPLLELQMKFTNSLTLTNSFLVNLLLQLTIALPVIFTTSALFFFTLERPFMRKDWASRLSPSIKKAIPNLSMQGSGYQKIALKMKKITASLITTLFIATVAFGQNDAIYHPEQLPPLDSLVKWAIEKNPAMRSQDIWIETQKQKLELQRRSWTDLIVVGGTALIGTNNVLDYQQTTTNSEYYSINRRSLLYNAGLTVRLSLGDVVNRADKSNLARLEWQRAEVDKTMIEDGIRQEVLVRYDKFVGAYKMLEIETQNVEAQRIALEVAEKYFKEGDPAVGEYSTVLSKFLAAKKQLEEAKLETNHAYRMLCEYALPRQSPITN